MPKGIIVNMAPVRHGSIIETIEDGHMKKDGCCRRKVTKNDEPKKFSKICH